MAHFRETCPNCYINKGFSITLDEQQDGSWRCRQCGCAYAKGDDGYLKKVA